MVMKKLQKLMPVLLGFLLFISASCSSSPDPVPNNGDDPAGDEPSQTTGSSNRVTLGERSLASGKDYFDPLREKAILAIADGKYNDAIESLNKYLEIEPNDPEARIFLNNLMIAEGDKFYTIAVSLPISSNLNASLEILRGVAHAQYDLNQSRASNQGKLRIAIADDDDRNPNNGTSIAQKVAKELSKNKEILGVVGPYSSDTSLDTAKIYESNELVVISPVSTSVELIGYSPYFFRTVPSDRVAARSLARYIQRSSEPSKVVAFYNSDSNYSKSLYQEFINELGRLNVVLRDDPDTDLATWSEDSQEWQNIANGVLNKAKENGANMIMLAPSSGHLDKAIKIALVNQKKLPILGGDDVYSPNTIDQGQGNVVGMIIAVAWDIEVNDSNSSFPRRSEEIWGTSGINWRTITAYDAVQALMKAIDNQSKPTREGVREELASPSFSTPGAIKRVQFLESGDYAGDIQLVQIRKIGSRYDFIPLEIE